MNFSVDTKEFLAALGAVGKVIPKKAVWPILGCVKVITNDDRITIVGSDSDTTIEIDIPAEVTTEGAAAIPFGPLPTFCRAAKSDRVTVVEDGKGVKVSSGRSRISLSPMPVDDYPNMRPIEGEMATIDAPAFFGALRYCASVVQEDDVKFHISGVHFAVGDDGLDVFGTDSNTFHRSKIAGAQIAGSGTLPLAAAHAILSAPGESATVGFLIQMQGWRIAAGSRRMWGKVIDSTYPDIRKLEDRLPQWEPFVSGARDDLSDAITVATCGSDADSNKSHSLIVRAEDGGPAVLRGYRAATGVMHAGRSEIPGAGRATRAAAINGKYLGAAISGLPEGDVSILSSAADNGTIIRVQPAQSDAAAPMSALIMTIRVPEGDMADV